MAVLVVVKVVVEWSDVVKGVLEVDYLDELLVMTA